MNHRPIMKCGPLAHTMRLSATVWCGYCETQATVANAFLAGTPIELEIPKGWARDGAGALVCPAHEVWVQDVGTTDRMRAGGGR